jgi:signal transduction histidine kinase
MGIRPKIFLIFFACGVAPVLLLIYMSNLNSVETVEAMLRGDLERDGATIARAVEARQREQEAGLVALARSASLRAYVQQRGKQSGITTHATPPLSYGATSTTAAVETVPSDVRADVGAFLMNKYYAGVTCLSVERGVLFRVEPDARAAEGSVLRYQTRDFLSNGNADERVWSVAERVPLLRAPLAREPAGMIVRYTVPVFTTEEGGGAQRGALVADMKADALFIESAGGTVEPAGANPRTSEAALPPRIIVALDSKGNIVYHSNDALRYQPVTSAMPSFKLVADRMLASDGGVGGGGGSGWAFYDSMGSRWLAVYRRVATLDASLAVAGNYTLAVEGLRRRGLLNLALAVLVGVLTAIVLSITVGRTARSIERVTEGAVAIAGGRFDQRIDVRSSDETSLLAQSFNIMSDRLRQQMAREAETRQFEAFLRLSAMMTHDLKNAIAALSLIVRNMERQFHREEFRADAMQSLALATDKLRALVARLSGPVESLSGEFKRPRPTDLVPIIRGVLAATAIPSDSIQLETRLPATLVAAVDAERIERVIENLIINALEAMRTQSSGKLTIEAGNTVDGKLFFSVADTGPGMSEEFQRDQLFHAFATTKKTGVGLGLYTCREVVRAHGGQIEVESLEGSGTCFRVVLPSASDRAT